MITINYFHYNNDSVAALLTVNGSFPKEDVQIHTRTYEMWVCTCTVGS